MDEAMRKMEARLEGLIPREISDSGRERLEETIGNLAENTVIRGAAGGAWKWGIGLAASLGLLAGVQLIRPPVEVQVAAGPIGTVVAAAPEVAGDQVPVVEMMTVSRQVEGRVDEGWVNAEGSPHVHRYWRYDVTDEDEVVDGETGYVVTVLSQREERIPVRMTSL